MNIAAELLAQPWMPAQAGLAFTAYFIAVASPGPSNLAIMGMAMNAGRRSALWLAAGVMTGSWFWGVLAALGLSHLLATFTYGLIAMKLLGGAYLLWLAWKSARAAAQTTAPASAVSEGAALSARALYLRGAGMHLTNPKAILSWLATVTLALPHGASPAAAMAVVGVCATLGALVFCSYALAFSTATARRAYSASRRWLEGLLAAVFGYAGVHLVASAAHAP